MRKDFCSFLLGACPLLQEYANIAYHSERHNNGVELEQHTDSKERIVRRADLMKPVLPIVSIEMPDWERLPSNLQGIYIGLSKIGS